MGYTLNTAQANQVLAVLRKDYTVYAPKRFRNQGRYSATDVIRYDEVERWEDIVWDVKSDYPAKEVLTPIQQALFYFTEDEYRESKGPKKPILVLARPCDINAQHVQAKIYAGNGGYTDLYYERMRELVKFALMECNGGDDTCFCVSMGTNKTDDYALAVKFSEDGAQIQVTDDAFAPYFEGMPQADYSPAFVEENELKVTLPDLEDKEVRKALKSHPMWKEYDARCISCGSCTVACSTCTCFTTRDVIYGDNPEVGERRRVTSSCQIAGFDQMAGQREFRSTAGDRMRYKVLHKFHDYKARFEDSHMCVGCGRCTHRCPELISISATLNKVSAAVDEIKAGQARQ
ncbi:MAG: anaerobic sulfite reductase subunit AsrA [Clostridiales bacterium]|nr:anaerobic sulfite reductase subunit AsrA [Clostridiales bacterium]